MSFKAIIFDLDGVITQTASVHNKAWKQVFDTFLDHYSKKRKEPFIPFDSEKDYLHYVDGKPRYDGVRSFLASRGISPPDGSPEDKPSMDTVCGIGNMKNGVFNEILSADGIEVYPSTVALIHRCLQEGIRVGVASSSKNCRNILEVTGLAPLVETRVDGEVSAELGLNGKPAPDIFLRAADNLGIHYHDCVVVEDASSGVAAGKKGNFGLVLGLARENNQDELCIHGADVVVTDIEHFGYEQIRDWFSEGIYNDNWQLTYHGYDPEKERSRESLMSVGNGYFGTRGAFEESGINQVNYPGTYMAGVYNKLPSTVSGRKVFNEDLVNVPNWLSVTFRDNDGEWVDFNNIGFSGLTRTLDFRTGLLTRTAQITTCDGGVYQLNSRRFASMANPELAAIRYEINVLNPVGALTLRAGLHGNHINDGVARYRDLNQQHLEPVSSSATGPMVQVEVKTTQSGIRIRQTALLKVIVNGKTVDVEWVGSTSPGTGELSATIPGITKSDQIVLEKVVHISALRGSEESGTDPVSVLKGVASFEALHEASAKAWQKLWDEVDIQVEGDRLAQKLLRMHIYHLLCTTSPHNTEIDFGIPARGLTGEAYRGHIFWDEMYILPFYFMHLPDVAKSVLMYRYRRLDAARAYARQHGYAGAMFPWQSGRTGEEETQQFHYNPVSGKWGDDNSSLQRHVSLAIAWNTIQYHHFTQDDHFMLDYGMEMLLEICRFWHSKCRLNHETGRYTIDKVMGPDEFHEAYPEAETGGLRDNAYTNVLVAWLFGKVDELLMCFPEVDRSGLLARTGFSETEIDQWQSVAKKLNLVISPEGIIAQYDGYFDLKELDFDAYREQYGNIYRLDRILKAEGKSPDQYKVAKQADTLMLFYILEPDVVKGLIHQMGYELPEDYLRKNLEYYIARTSHGSTLSRVVHAWLAGMTNQPGLAWELYRGALLSDYTDIQGGTTAEGIHTGVMAGTVLLAISLYGGFAPGAGQPARKAVLPDLWKSIAYKYTFRGKREQVEIIR